MKKVLTGITLASLLTLPLLVLAQVIGPPAISGDEFIVLLWDIVNWLFTILLIVAVIFIVIAAFYFLTAQGDPERFARARRFVLYALIGVGVAVASYGLVSLIVWIVGGMFW